MKINLPSFGAGDDALLTGSYTQSAVWYSGLPDMMWGENGQVNGNGQPMYHAGRLLQPDHQLVVEADRVVGLGPDRASLHAAVLSRPRRVGRPVEVEQPGRRLLHLRLRLRHSLRPRQGAISPSATTWLVGADLGWNPVNNLNFDLELMYQSTNQATPSGFLGTIYNCGPGERVLRAGRLARRQRRLRRPLPHHPLLLIAFRSVDLHGPGAKAPGFFCVAGPGRCRGQELRSSARLRSASR